MASLKEPRQGIHSIRLFDVAVIDTLLTILAAFLISKKHFISVLIILILLSIVIHTALNIRTKTNSWLIDQCFLL